MLIDFLFRSLLISFVFYLISVFPRRLGVGEGALQGYWRRSRHRLCRAYPQGISTDPKHYCPPQKQQLYHKNLSTLIAHIYRFVLSQHTCRRSVNLYFACNSLRNLCRLCFVDFVTIALCICLTQQSTTITTYYLLFVFNKMQ